MLYIGKVKPMDEEYVMPTNDKVDIQPWNNRYKAGAFVIFAMFSMYVVFSKLGLANSQGIRLVTFITIICIGILCGLGAWIMDRKLKEITYKIKNRIRQCD